MFTVVIAEQKHINRIKEYENFLKPLLDNKEFAICQWNTEGETIQTALPTLYETVGNRSDWRALVLVDFLPKDVQNPYDFVEHKSAKDISEMTPEELVVEEDKRKAAFQKAVTNPLTVLSHWLCGVLNEPDEDDKKAAEEKSTFGIFYSDKVAKYEALKPLHEDELKISSPNNILCLATRIYENETKELKESWENHDEIDYSKFCEFNLYPDQMRYLIYDIVPEDNYNYNLSYWKYLCVMLILAINDVPGNALTNERVYSLECEADNQALANLLFAYDEKLKKTKSHISAQIRTLENSFDRVIGEIEFEKRYLTQDDIILYASNEVDVSEMEVDPKPIGLAKDVPEDENHFWAREENQTRKVLGRYLKQPRRTLDKAVTDALKEKGVDEAGVLSLDQFQIYDIKEFADDNETRMSEIDTSNIYDVSEFNKRLNEKSKSVKDTIAQRMTKSTTLAAFGVMLLCFLFGSIPFIIKMFNNKGSLGYSLPLFIGGIVLLGLILFLVLRVFRNKLVGKIKDYNQTMRDIEDEVDDTVLQFGKYLTAAKTMRNSNEALNIFYGGEDSKTKKIKIMKMHINEINDIIKDNQHIINQIAPQNEPEKKEEMPYEHDFTQLKKHDYPLPLEEKDLRSIDFIQEDYKVKIPIDYIESIVAVREEIYE